MGNMYKSRKLLRGVAVLSLAAMLLFGMAACAEDTESQKQEEVTPTCAHNLTHVNRTEPTCISDGNIGYYVCSVCNQRYFDEAATIELSEENIVVPKTAHSLEQHAAAENVAEYWNCIACGKYFLDAQAASETTYKELYKDYYHPIKLADVTTGDIFNADSEISPLYDNFTFRCFMTWSGAEGENISKFPDQGRVQVNINLNREGAGSRVDWYNFGIGYTKADGLTYKPMVSGACYSAPEAFSELFVKQGGIYVVVVRDGTTVSFYFEDENGERTLINSNSGFGADEAVVRLAANQAEGIDGWIPSTSDTAICIGVADPKCIFDKAYD